MSVSLTGDELRIELDFHRKPLSQVQETTHEWLIGTWTLSKSHRTWRVGYGHPLVSGATFRMFPFDIDGHRGIGVLFESADQPPWIMVGWVPPDRANAAEAWVAFLNSEIVNRLADRSAGENTTFDPHDGSTAAGIEGELTLRRLDLTRPPSKLIK